MKPNVLYTCRSPALFRTCGNNKSSASFLLSKSTSISAFITSKVSEAPKRATASSYIFKASSDCFEACNNNIFSRYSAARSEERRVGKECRSRWSPDDSKQTTKIEYVKDE